MADRIGESRLLAHEDFIGDQIVLLEGMAQQVFADAVGVHLLFGIDGHAIGQKIQVSEGNAGLQGVDADAAVGAQNVVHVDLPDPLLRLLLKSIRIGGKICIFVAEDLIGDLAGQDDTDVGVFMDPLADQIHADRGADSRDVPGSQGVDDRLQSSDDIVSGHDHFVVVAADIVRHFAGVFEIDSVYVHADGKSLQGLIQALCRRSADQGGIQAAG